MEAVLIVGLVVFMVVALAWIGTRQGDQEED